MESMLFSGEEEALLSVEEAGKSYGYGNCIALLKRRWADMLKRDHGFSEKDALKAADTSAYPEGFEI